MQRSLNCWLGKIYVKAIEVYCLRSLRNDCKSHIPNSCFNQFSISCLMMNESSRRKIIKFFENVWYCQPLMEQSGGIGHKPSLSHRNHVLFWSPHWLRIILQILRYKSIFILHIVSPIADEQRVSTIQPLKLRQ